MVISSQAVDDDVVQVVAQVVLHLLLVLDAGHLGDDDGLLLPDTLHFVLEVRVDIATASEQQPMLSCAKRVTSRSPVR
jgi:hypothetical protein